MRRSNPLGRTSWRWFISNNVYCACECCGVLQRCSVLCVHVFWCVHLCMCSACVHLIRIYQWQCGSCFCVLQCVAMLQRCGCTYFYVRTCMYVFCMCTPYRNLSITVCVVFLHVAVCCNVAAWCVYMFFMCVHVCMSSACVHLIRIYQQQYVSCVCVLQCVAML